RSSTSLRAAWTPIRSRQRPPWHLTHRAPRSALRAPVRRGLSREAGASPRGGGARSVMRSHAVLLAVALGLVSKAARADTPEAVSAPSQPSPQRAVPDFDGRGPEPTAGAGGLWVPPVVLSPPYCVSNYVIRLPLSLAVPGAERAALPRKVYDFF